MNPADVHVLHGYYLPDLDRLARAGVRGARSGPGRADDWYRAAWDAIVDALVDAGTHPSEGLLVHAARYAVERAWGVERHHHGIASIGGPAPKFAVYWLGLSGPAPSPEERVVERVALGQIWAQLTDLDREALTVLAATNSMRASAALLDLRYHTYGERVRAARARALALWHEGETPSRIWRRDRRERRAAA